MSQQDSCDPLSFKGQMAARYRERMSMGFALGNGNKSDDNDTSVVPYSTPPTSEAPGATERQGVIKSSDIVDSNDVSASRETAKAVIPVAVRSKSTLGDRQINVNKSTMKDLITKFETRSQTSSQLKQNVETVEESGQDKKDPWSCGFRRTRLDLDTIALISSSSSDAADSKSSGNLPKASQWKAATATLGQASDSNSLKHQPFGWFSRSLSRFSSTETGLEKSGIHDCLNVTNSHRSTDSQSVDSCGQPDDAIKSAEVTSGPKEQQPTNPAASTAGLTEKPSTTGDDPKQCSDDQKSTAPPPLRVSLRGIAKQRKLSSDNKYVVHKKDWGKRLAKKDQMSLTQGTSDQETVGDSVLSSFAFDRETPRSDVIARSLLDSHKEESNRSKLRSTPSSDTQHRGDTRASSRLSELLDDSKESLADDKHKTKAMERYLQFLKSNNSVSVPSMAKSREKSENKKALRPPTPHRANNLIRGSNNAPKSTIQTTKEVTQPKPAAQQTVEQNSKPDSDTKVGKTFHRRPRSKPVLSANKKDVVIDPSGGDFFVATTVSSPNSVASSVYDHHNKLNLSPRLGQPKTEVSDVRLPGPLSTEKPKSKWNYLSTRSGKTTPKNPTTRPHSARGHETSDKKQGRHFGSHLRARSSSANKSPELVGIKKHNPVIGPSLNTAPTAFSTVSGTTTQQTPPRCSNITDRTAKTPKCVSSDIASHILTEDEIADNDLVPVHLRERKTHGKLSLMHSSSDESNCGRTKTPALGMTAMQLRKATSAAVEKYQHEEPEIIDRMEPQCLVKREARSLIKHEEPKFTKNEESKFQKNDDCKFLRNNSHSPRDYRPSTDGKESFIIHGKRKIISTPTQSFTPSDQIIDDRTGNRNSLSQYPKGLDAPLGAHANLVRTGDMLVNSVTKEARDLKEGSNLHSHVVPDDRKGHNMARDRRMNYEFFNAQEPASNNARGDNLHAVGDSYTEKGLTYQPSRLSESTKESPTRKSAYRRRSSHNSSFMKDVNRDKKLEAEPGLPAGPRDGQPKASENMYNLFHFGHSDIKDDNLQFPDSRHEKLSMGSPQKKRKSEQPRKVAKKKKEESTELDSSPVVHSQVTPRTTSEKRAWKEKGKDNKPVKDESEERLARAEKMEASDIPVRRKSSGELSTRSHVQGRHWKDYSYTWSSRKGASAETSPSSACTDFEGTPKRFCPTPEKLSTGKKHGTPHSHITDMRTVSRLTGDATDRFPMKSHIPLLIISSITPRSKLDKLIQYRRWREAMLDCLRPSKLPLSETFRKTLDSAVMEEWALHCWQPSEDMYVDSQGVWWSASYQEVENSGAPDSLLGDGSLFSKEGLLDLTARLPYMKLGPVRFLHATYLLMALACLVLGHLGVKLYHCGGDEYEYYCQDDDFDCLMQMFSQSPR